MSICRTASALLILALSVPALPAPSRAQAARCDAAASASPSSAAWNWPSLSKDAQGNLQLRFCAPDAHDVRFTSSDLDTVPNGIGGAPAGIAMTRGEDGAWTVTLPPAARPGPFRYAFRVDGVDVADPQSTRFALNARGVRSVAADDADLPEIQKWHDKAAHGLVSTLEYRSRSLGIVRRAHVYTPPGYEAADRRRYPVLYLVHGAGDSDDSWTSIGRAQYILDNLIAAGKARPMIVVMPFGHTPPRPGVGPGRNVDFASDLEGTLIPYVDSHFRTIATAGNRAMAGLSMGGWHSLQFGLPRPDLFGAIGIFSMGVPEGEAGAEYRRIHDKALKLRAQGKGPVFFAMGRNDFLHDLAPPTLRLLDDYRIKHVYVDSGGGHDWINWRNYLADFVPLLFR